MAVSGSKVNTKHKLVIHQTTKKWSLFCIHNFPNKVFSVFPKRKRKFLLLKGEPWCLPRVFISLFTFAEASQPIDNYKNCALRIFEVSWSTLGISVCWIPLTISCLSFQSSTLKISFLEDNLQQSFRFLPDQLWILRNFFFVE